MKWNKNYTKILVVVAMLALLVSVMSVTAFAASGDVAGAVQSTWNAAKVQIKSVVNNVVFPVIDLVLAVCFFAKVALVYMDYRKHWSARVDSSRDPVCNARVCPYRTSLYLGHHRYVSTVGGNLRVASDSN